MQNKFDQKVPVVGDVEASYDVRSGPTSASLQRKEARDQRFEKALDRIQLATRILVFLLAIYTFYSQAYMLDLYHRTYTIVRDGRDPWADHSVLWPSLVMLAVSVITVLVNAVIVVSYFWGTKAANSMYKRVHRPWKYTAMAVHFVVWIGTAIAYRVGKTGDDLWGWTCSPKAQAIQTLFPEVNYQSTCNLQTNAWTVSLVEVAVFLLSLVIQTSLFCLTSAKRALGLGRKVNKHMMDRTRRHLNNQHPTPAANAPPQHTGWPQPGPPPSYNEKR